MNNAVLEAGTESYIFDPKFYKELESDFSDYRGPVFDFFELQVQKLKLQQKDKNKNNFYYLQIINFCLPKLKDEVSVKKLEELFSIYRSLYFQILKNKLVLSNQLKYLFSEENSFEQEENLYDFDSDSWNSAIECVVHERVIEFIEFVTKDGKGQLNKTLDSFLKEKFSEFSKTESPKTGVEN